MTSKARRRHEPVAYADSGVDIDTGNALIAAIKPLVRATRRPGAEAEIGGFAGPFDLKAAGYADPVLVAATDGVGTKLMLAVDTGILDTVGIDLVAMAVNDLIVQGAEPLFFLDYLATGRLDPVAGRAIVAGIAEGCRRAGAALIGGETAEMPGLYREKHFDLAGFAVGAVERDRMLPRGDVARGDVILAIASSGLHANGFSLVRKLTAESGLGLDRPAPFDEARSLGRALLTPTRIYVGPVLRAVRATGAVKALAHITGGGLTDNIPRALPEGVAARIDLARLPVPPVFRWLAGLGGVSETEMLRTFNCGIGMIAVTAAADAGGLTATLESMGESVIDIGRIESRERAAVVYDGALDLRTWR